MPISTGPGSSSQTNIVYKACLVALLFSVVLLSIALHRANSDLEALREETFRRLAAVETTPVPVHSSVRSLQDDCLSSDDASSLAVRAAFAIKEDQHALSVALTAKADSSTLATLATTVGEKAHQSDLDALTVTVGEKAVAADMTTALAAKADASALVSLTTTVGDKADQSALDALTVTVGEKAVAADMTTALAAKADASALVSLTTTVGDKADQSALDALTVTVGEKAVAADMTTALAAKADASALVSLTTTVGDKADQSALDALTVTVGEKAVAADMTTALAAKADASALVSLTTTIGDKADQSALDALTVTVGEKAVAADMTTALAAKADASALDALVAQVGSAVAEVNPCRCAECADEPVGGDLCASYGPVTPCECEDSSGSSDPVRQTYPMTQSDPPCCQEEWPAAPTVTQATTTAPQVFDEDDIMVRIGGQVTFDWAGFENLEQVSDFDSYTAVSDGIRSGDPTSAGSFTHTFDTAGEYYFRSYVHESLQVKVTVIECVSCIVVAGYDGANPATLALALSSRAAGDFALAISSAGLARVMTLLTVYDGQTLTLTGEDSEVGQLPMADAKITALDGASVVVNNAFVSGGVALAQRATLDDNTGQVAPTASGMAIPKVDPTPAIENAAVASIDESADTVTLAQIDASVAAGQALQLSDAAGQTCTAAPKGEDLLVLSVDGATISFSTNITSAGGNCVLSRAEVYSLPACQAGDAPAVIYTHMPSLDMDVLMTCSEVDAEMAWRPVLTTGGVNFDSADIAAFAAAIGSGLPGIYVLRLFGDAQSFLLPSLHVGVGQDVHIVSTATGDSTLEFGIVSLRATSQLTLRGTIVLSSAAFLSCAVSTDEERGINLGLVKIETGVSLRLSDGTVPSVTGTMPGSFALELDGAPVATIERSADASEATISPSTFLEVAVDGFLYAGGGFFELPETAGNMQGCNGCNAGNDGGVSWYVDKCYAAGLYAVGGNHRRYSSDVYTRDGRNRAVSVWDGDWGWSGSMNGYRSVCSGAIYSYCDPDLTDYLANNGGFRNIVYLGHDEPSEVYDNRYPMSGDGDAMDCSQDSDARCFGRTGAVHPICALAP